MFSTGILLAYVFHCLILSGWEKDNFSNSVFGVITIVLVAITASSLLGVGLLGTAVYMIVVMATAAPVTNAILKCFKFLASTFSSTKAAA